MTSTRLRPATLADVSGIAGLRERLPLHGSAVGGFLLGCSPERYAQLIAAGLSAVVVRPDEGHGEQICGFGIVLTDSLLRSSELWELQSNIQWENFDPAQVESERVAYFDQLALAPETPRWFAPALGLHLLEQAFVDHDHVLATTVVEPVLNQAALPLLRAAGAVRVGLVAEVYPEVGLLSSALHWISRDTWSRRRGVSGAVRAARTVQERLKAEK